MNGATFYVRGVSYGAFRPDAERREYQDPARIARDFAQMQEAGINTVRIPHTMPPRHLLDLAAQFGLRVIVGLSAEQFVGYLIDRHKAPDVHAIIRSKVSAVAGHPALLCYALGNEISPSLARWLRPRSIERYLGRLCEIVKQEDPDGLVTYVNFPTTEYLHLPFLDLVSFNVYLESNREFEAYIARLQNIAGGRPLLLTEVGLDSLRNGEERQAQALADQVRIAFAEGCCGTIVFAWTDEWYRAGEDVDDWEFGVTTRARHRKPAFFALRDAYDEVPFSARRDWPAMSVVVCTHNGSRTIRDCLDGLAGLTYPDYEVIVVDDGSTDQTAAIVREYSGVRLISAPNRGLSAARNLGLSAAQSRFVAYLDDDAHPDPRWLHFLADAFLRTSHAAVGGPNLAPPGDGLIASAVAVSPGGPAHVLLDDRVAEHIPGCNMAFRRDVLDAVGGFDPVFRVAGDDVDVCWKIHARGGTIGFCAGAVVWHHRRNSLRAFWKQQRGYGHAESLLEARWPEKYNRAGHTRWAGRVYGAAMAKALRLINRPRVYHGVWGLAPFQSREERPPSVLFALPLMPEWYFVLLALLALCALGAWWRPALVAAPVAAVAFAATLIDALGGALAARYDLARLQGAAGVSGMGLTVMLHLLQPLARLLGRLSYGLTPWRRRRTSHLDDVRHLWPRSNSMLRHGAWQPATETLAAIERALRRAGVIVQRGAAYDDWDLCVHAGLLGSARGILAVEDHGPVTQLIRWRSWPTFSSVGMTIFALLAGFAVAAFYDRAEGPAVILAVLGLLLLIRHLQEGASAAAALQAAASAVVEGEPAKS